MSHKNESTRLDSTLRNYRFCVGCVLTVTVGDNVIKEIFLVCFGILGAIVLIEFVLLDPQETQTCKLSQKVGTFQTKFKREGSHMYFTRGDRTFLFEVGEMECWDDN